MRTYQAIRELNAGRDVNLSHVHRDDQADVRRHANDNFELGQQPFKGGDIIAFNPRHGAPFGLVTAEQRVA